MKEMHDSIRLVLEKSTEKYKQAKDKNRRDVQLQVRDLVQAFLKKERLPKGKHTKLLMKKVGPYQILQKDDIYAYVIEFPSHLGISPIFDICELTPYKGDVNAGSEVQLEVLEEYVVGIPAHEPRNLDKILDTKVIKQTRKNVHKKYLVKWQGIPKEESVWMDEQDIMKHGSALQHLISRRLEINAPREYYAGALPKSSTASTSGG